MKYMMERTHYPAIRINNRSDITVVGINEEPLIVRDVRLGLMDAANDYESLLYDFKPISVKDGDMPDWLSEDEVFGFTFKHNDSRYDILLATYVGENELFINLEEDSVEYYYDDAVESFGIENIIIRNAHLYRGIVKITTGDKEYYTDVKLYLGDNGHGKPTRDVISVSVNTAYQPREDGSASKEIEDFFEFYPHTDERKIYHRCYKSEMCLKNEGVKPKLNPSVLDIIDDDYQKLSLAWDMERNKYYFVYMEPNIFSGNRLAKPFYATTKDKPELNRLLWDIVFNSDTITVTSNNTAKYQGHYTVGTLIDTYTISSENNQITCQKKLYVDNKCYHLDIVKGSVKDVSDDIKSLDSLIKSKTINICEFNSGSTVADIVLLCNKTNPTYSKPIRRSVRYNLTESDAE